MRGTPPPMLLAHHGSRRLRLRTFFCRESLGLLATHCTLWLGQLRPPTGSDRHERAFLEAGDHVTQEGIQDPHIARPQQFASVMMLWCCRVAVWRV